MNILWLLLFIATNKIKSVFSAKKTNDLIDKTTNNFLSDGATIVYKSETPSGVHIGSLIYDKEYEKAIQIGEKILKKNPYSASVHINLMDAYFKTRNSNPEYLWLSTYHAKQAMICGHNTGYANQRLVINLEKTKMIHQAIQLCDIILDKRYRFSNFGFGKKEDYANRKEKLMRKLHLAQDAESDKLFTDEELDILYMRNHQFGSGHEGYTS